MDDCYTDAGVERIEYGGRYTVREPFDRERLFVSTTEHNPLMSVLGLVAGFWPARHELFLSSISTV